MAEQIEKLSDFIEWSRDCSKQFGIRNSTQNPWFRGQANIEWALRPTLYRGDFEHQLEREMLRDFRAYASEFLEHRERKDIDWLFLAQHHGLPTRLLDWTENPLVSLYFACKDSSQGSADAVVWSLNPWELNKFSIGLQTVPPTDSPILDGYVIDLSDSTFPRLVKAEFPIAVRPYHRFRRSNAQSGLFTVHGKKVQAIDKTTFVRRNRSACFRSIVVPKDRKLGLLRELYAVGMHPGALFQTIEGFAETVSFRYGNRYFNFQ